MEEALEMLEDLLQRLDYESRLSYLLDLGFEEDAATNLAALFEANQEAENLTETV